MKDLAVGYLKSKALSDRDKALMSLKLLTENAVGIGDHSTGDFYKNLDEALDLLIDAEDRIETLEKYFGTENANN
jgi:hypothetical protein